MANPMSAKIVVSSSITWLSGWIRPCSAGGFAQRQRDVDGLGGKPRVERRGFQDVAARGRAPAVTRILGEIDRRALRLAFVRRHLAERRQQRRDRALLAERGDAHGFERGFIAGGGDVGEDRLFEGCEVGHGNPFWQGCLADAPSPSCPGLCRASTSYSVARVRRGCARDKPGHDDFECSQKNRGATAYAASAALAFSAIAWNAAGSWMARSDSTLRSTVMPDLARPLMNTL